MLERLVNKNDEVATTQEKGICRENWKKEGNKPKAGEIRIIEKKEEEGKQEKV